MSRRSSLIRVGIFVILGGAAVVVGIFLVGKEEGLFRESFHVSSYFNTIEGLRTGASVRLSGVDVGIVDKITIAPQNNKVRIDLKLRKGVKSFIKKDSYSAIEQEGLVGSKYVSLSVGSSGSDEVSDGDILLSKEPFRLSVIIEDAQEMIANTRQATAEFTKILAAVNAGHGTLGKLITDEDVYLALKRATAQADTSLRKTAEEFANIPKFVSGVSENLYGVTKNVEKLLFDVDSTVVNVRDIVGKINKGEGTLGALVVERNIYDSLMVIVRKGISMAEAARDGADRFDENMEALRHNWFFKGYFEDRGYWDKAEYEKELDAKIAELKKLEEKLNKQADELKVREELLRKREESVPQETIAHSSGIEPRVSQQCVVASLPDVDYPFENLRPYQEMKRVVLTSSIENGGQNHMAESKKKAEELNLMTGLACPIPISDYPQVLLAHGGGGKLSQQIIQKMVVPQFKNELLEPLHDGAVFTINGTRLAFSTDSYVINPIFFPGGDIGELAVNGTVNDLAMCGARPMYLSAAFIIEEGFAMDDLWKVIQSMQSAAVRAGVELVTGDTKVVDRGKGDKIFINTSGIGIVDAGVQIGSQNARLGDVIVISGPIAVHGIAIMSVREGLEFESQIKSDTAALNHLVQSMLKASKQIHVLRDPTRGGVASSLNEIAESSNVGMMIYEERIPIAEPVRGACEILGLDPLYVANEGKLLAFVSPEDAGAVLSAMRSDPLGKESAVVGEVVAAHKGTVVMKTSIGGSRVVDMLSGEQLPRIC